MVIDLPRRPRQVGAGGEQVEVAVPLRVGLGQLALQLVGQRQVLVKAGVGVAQLDGVEQVAHAAGEVLVQAGADAEQVVQGRRCPLGSPRRRVE